MFAVIVTDQVGLGSLILAGIGMILAIPAAYVAWTSIRALHTSAEAEKIGKIVKDQLDKVVRQLTPTNGKTTAHGVESIEKKLDANKREYSSAIEAVLHAVTELQEALLNHLRDHPK